MKFTKPGFTFHPRTADAPASMSWPEEVMFNEAVKDAAEETASSVSDKASDAPANSTTELVFVLDRSGSMSGLEDDTIGGFNSMLKKQQAEPGSAFITTVLFNQKIEVLQDRLPLEKALPLTGADYTVYGGTALIDALGVTVQHIETIHKYARPEDVPAHTLFVIITDGMENSSHMFSSSEVKKTIRKKTERDGWEFLFLGANIDAVETASHYGIRSDRAVTYHSDSFGTRLNYDAVSKAASSLRKSACIQEDWQLEIAENEASHHKD